MKTGMWASIGLYIALLLFQLAAIGPVVFIALVCTLTAVAVVPPAMKGP